ncbi:MAG: hypothetical protein PHS86_06800 [Syntrophaceae bacterium]|nr:hypothetical protein [Syntrophaceae bacterium]
MKETLFMGRITATVTHEIKNVLAIIRESGGLMEDFLNMVEGDNFKYKDRFHKIISNIEDQVVRGDAISTLLNRFAHSPDADVASENVPDLLDQMIVLSARLAKAKEIVFKSDKDSGVILISSDPIRIRMLIFQAMDVLMNYCKPGQTILVNSKVNDSKLITLEFSVDSKTQVLQEFEQIILSDQWKDLISTVESLDSKAFINPENGTLRLELRSNDNR